MTDEKTNGETEQREPLRSNDLLSTVSCYDSNRDVLSVVYDPNGNALTYGELVDRINQLQGERQKMRDGVKAWSYCTSQGMKAECPEKVDELGDFLMYCGTAPHYVRRVYLGG